MIESSRMADDVLIVRPAGDMTSEESPQLRQEILGLIQKHKPGRAIVHMDQVSFCDSSGVAVLVEALGALPGGAGGHKLTLAAAAPRVRAMIEICKLTSILTLVDTEAEALATK